MLRIQEQLLFIIYQGFVSVLQKNIKSLSISFTLNGEIYKYTGSVIEREISHVARMYRGVARVEN